MGLIRELQDEHQVWVDHNFPDQDPIDPVLGMAEEVGELCHATLKHRQRIRGIDDKEWYAKVVDALGDLFIYAMSYSNANGIDLETAIEETWADVKKRDWITYPETGLPS